MLGECATQVGQQLQVLIKGACQNTMYITPAAVHIISTPPHPQSTHLSNVNVHITGLSVHPHCIVTQDPAHSTLPHIGGSHYHHLHKYIHTHIQLQCRQEHFSPELIFQKPVGVFWSLHVYSSFGSTLPGVIIGPMHQPLSQFCLVPGFSVSSGQ